MADKAEEKEIWRTYPDYPFIQASNLGRVRIADRVVTYKNGAKHFYKGHILKQQILPNGYMQVRFSINGKTIHLSVHRVVAICFIPNPDELPEVNHRDNDRTNNYVSNLEWCTRQYNIDYKKKFGTSSADIQGRSVVAINLKTFKILRFKSQSEAARQLGVDVRDVNNVFKGKQNTAGGLWFTEDESEITEEKIKEIKANMRFFGGVIAVDLRFLKVLRFKSQSEAACQLGINRKNINAVVNGRTKTAGGYYFCYADENAVEKVRSKFGDELANEVKKLLNQNKN